MSAGPHPRTSRKTVVGLDLGSNTFSCAALSSFDDGAVEIIEDTSRAVRLSQNLTEGGPLSQEAIDRGLSTLRQLAVEFETGTRPTRVVGTAALRLTSDPAPFIEPAEEILGARIEIIDGLEEALLVSEGAVHGLEEATGPWVVVDVGGRSTELCWTERGTWRPESLPMGVVGLTNQFFDTDPPTGEQVEALSDRVGEILAGSIPRDIAGTMVGVAGTASTLGRLEAGAIGWDRDLVHGKTVSLASLEKWLARTLELDTAQRMKRMGLGPARADVFPAGLCILAQVARHLNRDHIVVSANGLRVGAALSLLEE